VCPYTIRSDTIILFRKECNPIVDEPMDEFAATTARSMKKKTSIRETE
jgi:hypothetical protein